MQTSVVLTFVCMHVLKRYTSLHALTQRLSQFYTGSHPLLESHIFSRTTDVVTSVFVLSFVALAVFYLLIHIAAQEFCISQGEDKPEMCTKLVVTEAKPEKQTW